MHISQTRHWVPGPSGSCPPLSPTFLAQSLNTGPTTSFPEELARMQASAVGDYYYYYCSYYYYYLNTSFPEKKKKVICKDALLGDK